MIGVTELAVVVAIVLAPLLLILLLVQTLRRTTNDRRDMTGEDARDDNIYRAPGDTPGGQMPAPDNEGEIDQ
jgi:hypothetical protein